MTARPLRVALVSQGGLTGPGGIVRVATYITGHWRDPSITIRLFDSYGPAGTARMPFYFLRSFLCFALALLGRRIDVVHIAMAERLSVPRKAAYAKLAQAFGLPVVVHMHGADFADFYHACPGWAQRAMARFLASCAQVVCLGGFWRDFVVGTMGVPADKVMVLHNAVPEPDRPLRRDPDSCRILFLGVLGERKGVPTLIRALAQPRLRDLPWHAVLAGNGDAKGYARMAAELGIGDRISFPGLLDGNAARDQLAQAHVLALPSRNEGLPMSILEAMSFGCAVVSTPVGAIADAVTEGETGLLVPVDDVEALSIALARLVADPVLCRRMGEQGQARFYQDFAITPYNQALAQLWHGVAEGR